MSTSRLCLIALAVAAACAPAPEPPPPAPEPGPRLESPGMGLALASVPAGFEVAENDGERIVLTKGAGTVTIATGPVERFGINLVDAVLARKSAFEEAPGGVYKGNRELRAPIGTAFTSRGEYTGESGPIEETWIYAIHPGENRLLTLTYAYPPTESESRAPEALSVLGEIEALAPAGGGEPE